MKIRLVSALGALLLTGPLRAEVVTQPWAAEPTTMPSVEERTFSNGAVQLRGNLYMPRSSKPVAAIVVLHGASSPLRTSPLYQHLTEMLPSLGVAVLVYDRRGSGESTGDRSKASFEDLADDGSKAVEMLRADKRIDPARIGVWGLSQGGWLSMLAASRSPHVKFAVAISAPVVTADVQMMFSSTNSLRVNGFSDADISQMTYTRNAVDNYMRGRGDIATAQQAVDAAKAKPWYRYLYFGTTVRDRATSGWRKEIEHEPLSTLEKVRVPMLVLYGATDPVVPVTASIRRLAAIAPSHPNLRVAVIAKADHGMELDRNPRDLLDPDQADQSKPNAAEYFAILTRWLVDQKLTQNAWMIGRK